MKIFTQIIIALSSLISSTTAASTPNPKGYITTYTVPDCSQVGGVSNDVNTDLPLNTCVNLDPFTSFQGGMAVSCPSGTLPDVKAYTQNGCVGSAVDAGGIPSDYFDGPCVEIVAETGGATLSLGGHSALFTCVEN